MVYTTHTPTDITKVKAELEEKAKEFGFGVLKTYEFKDILEGKGFPIEREIIVFEICNPAGAQKALTKSPNISVCLPCRISIYEEEEGTTLVTVNIEDMFAAVEVDDEMKGEMYNLFDDIKKIVHSWDDETS